MKEPNRIPLTDNPRAKEPQKLPLKTDNYYDIEMVDDIYQLKNNEDHQQNNTTSIQQLESDKTN